MGIRSSLGLSVPTPHATFDIASGLLATKHTTSTETPLQRATNQYGQTSPSLLLGRTRGHFGPSVPTTSMSPMCGTSTTHPSLSDTTIADRMVQWQEWLRPSPFPRTHAWPSQSQELKRAICHMLTRSSPHQREAKQWSPLPGMTSSRRTSSPRAIP
jgi:hypothetical protein